MIKQKIVDFFSLHWVRYVLAGGIAYALELIALFILHIAFGLSAEIATAIAFWVGLPAAFLLQKIFTFKDYQKTLKTISKQVTAYVVLIGINYTFTLALVSLLPDEALFFSRTLALIITTLWNFMFYRFMFHPETRPTPETIKRGIKNAFMLKNKYVNMVLLALPIIIFSIPLLAGGEKITPGDADYYFQLNEAFRRTVLEFHQFPSLNPWIAGGVPLFANVQFGMVSLQAPLVLIFGTVMGMKLAILGYQLIGFFGFRKLFKDGFGTSPFRAACLAYLPMLSSFFVYRSLGHFTFLLIAFVPWLIYFFLKRDKKYSWIGFGLAYSIMVLTFPHYTTIMSMVVIAIWFAYEVLSRLITALRTRIWDVFLAKLKKDAIFFAKAGALIVGLCAYRMYFVADFIKDFPRHTTTQSETFTGIFNGLYAIWGPHQYGEPIPQLPTGYGWVEATAYIGIGTLACLLLVLFVYHMTNVADRKKLFSYPMLLLGALFMTCFIMGMGDFGQYSPYNILSHFPVFDSMRVATRWLLWAALCALFILAAYKGKRFNKIINGLLVLSVIELFVTGIQLHGVFRVELEQYQSPQSSFTQEFYNHVPRTAHANDKNFQTVFWYDENLLESTQNNVGQIIASDSLVNTSVKGMTIRCGANQGNCPFISPNAYVDYWSPNKIVLKRTAPGPIELNMNPGKGWRVNKVYAFADYRVVDPLRKFIIEDTSETIVLDYLPKFSPGWVLSKLGL